MIAGAGLAVLCVAAGVVAVRALLSRPQPHAMWPVALFFAFALAALAGIGLSPMARLLRDRALLRRWSERWRACPSCGASRGAESRCPVCEHPLDDAHLYWVVSSRHWSETAAASLFAPSAASLAVFFAMVAGHARDLSTAVVLWLFVLGLGAAAAMTAWFASLSLRQLRSEPSALSYTRSWERDGAWWYTTSKCALRGDEWTAEGQSEGPAREPPRASDDGSATAFERGLAALLASWNRDEKAPLSAAQKFSWRLVPSGDLPPSTGADSVYREAAQASTSDGVARETHIAWTVSFNQYPAGELLEEAKLPAPAYQPDDDECVELFDADWSVDLAQVVRVFSRDQALRAAIEALATSIDDDHVRLALDALRLSRA